MVLFICGNMCFNSNNLLSLLYPKCYTTDPKSWAFNIGDNLRNKNNVYVNEWIKKSRMMGKPPVGN